MSDSVPIPEWVYEAAWLARPHFKINRSDPRRPDVAARAHGIRMVDAAAPHIDRLARIDELKQWVERLDRGGLTTVDRVEDVMRQRIAELED